MIYSQIIMTLAVDNLAYVYLGLSIMALAVGLVAIAAIWHEHLKKKSH